MPACLFLNAIFTGCLLSSDATLVTQRVHYAAIPHEYRHVYGWFGILTEIRNEGIDAICVFDGKERSQAKKAEVRRHALLEGLYATRSLILHGNP